MEGFGEKSCANLLESIEKARKTTLARVIYGLGIAGVGLANAKVLCREFDDSPEALLHAGAEDLAAISGVGEVIAGAFTGYFAREENREEFRNLLKELELVHEEGGENQNLKGKTFVVTGSLQHFPGRRELKEWIESRGGKVTGSVTGKTDYLINNDVNSASSKNRKARELNIPVISEEDFMELAGTDLHQKEEQ